MLPQYLRGLISIVCRSSSITVIHPVGGIIITSIIVAIAIIIVISSKESELLLILRLQLL